MVAFQSQKNYAISSIMFSYKSYMSLLSFQEWQSSKLSHTNEELFLLKELARKQEIYLTPHR